MLDFFHGQETPEHHPVTSPDKIHHTSTGKEQKSERTIATSYRKTAHCKIRSSKKKHSPRLTVVLTYHKKYYATMSNPRRNAFEYGVLVTLASSMAASYAILLAYAMSTDENGKRRKIPKVNLEDEIDLGKAWEEVKSSFWSLRRGDINGAVSGWTANHTKNEKGQGEDQSK